MPLSLSRRAGRIAAAAPLLLAAACATVPRPAPIATSRLGIAKAAGTVARGVLQLELAGQIRTVTKLSSEVEVGTEWSESAGKAQYRVWSAVGIDRCTVFQARTGLSRDQVVSLLVQGLSPAEETQGLANSFFIDATGCSRCGWRGTAATRRRRTSASSR